MARFTGIPEIPDVPQSVDRATSSVLKPVREVLQRLLGRIPNTPQKDLLYSKDDTNQKTGSRYPHVSLKVASTITLAQNQYILPILTDYGTSFSQNLDVVGWDPTNRNLEILESGIYLTTCSFTFNISGVTTNGIVDSELLALPPGLTNFTINGTGSRGAYSVILATKFDTADYSSTYSHTVTVGGPLLKGTRITCATYSRAIGAQILSGITSRALVTKIAEYPNEDELRTEENLLQVVGG